MDERERPLSTADIAGGGMEQDMEERAETGSAELTGRPAAPEGATDTTAMPSQTRGGAAAAEEPQALLDEQEAEGFRTRWEALQTGFVDEPRGSVEQADQLVAEVMRRLAETFAQARQELEGQWAGGGEAGTEELRVALRRYRTFFETLLRR